MAHDVYRTVGWVLQVPWLIKRDRNHPSVVIWSICNEVLCNSKGNEADATARQTQRQNKSTFKIKWVLFLISSTHLPLLRPRMWSLSNDICVKNRNRISKVAAIQKRLNGR